MGQELQEIKILLKDLVAEVADLRERIVRLERILNQESQDSRERVIYIAGEGYENIGKLYREGYHICPAAYGRPRDEGECLFCLNIIEKK